MSATAVWLLPSRCQVTVPMVGKGLNDIQNSDQLVLAIYTYTTYTYQKVSCVSISALYLAALLISIPCMLIMLLQFESMILLCESFCAAEIGFTQRQVSVKEGSYVIVCVAVLSGYLDQELYLKIYSDSGYYSAQCKCSPWMHCHGNVTSPCCC